MFFKTTTGSNGGSISDSDTSVVITDDFCITDGSDGNLTGLEIYAKIESEIVKITAFNRTTSTATIERAQFSTDAAAHDDGSTVSPYNETPTYAEAGSLLGPHDWTVSDGTARNWQKFSYELSTGRMFDPLQSGSSASDGIHNVQIEGTGSFDFILDTTQAEFFKELDNGDSMDLAITVGSDAGSIFTFDFDECVLTGSTPANLQRHDVAIVTQEFRTRDTATALRGQFKMTES
jgi:hypothetical protein